MDKLRSRQRDSSKFKTVERQFNKDGVQHGSLGVSFTDTDADGFADKVSKTNRAENVNVIKPTVISRPGRSTKIAASANAAVKAAINPPSGGGGGESSYLTIPSSLRYANEAALYADQSQTQYSLAYVETTQDIYIWDGGKWVIFTNN